PLPAAMFGVNEKDRAWVDAKLTKQPTKCFVTPVALTGARERVRKKAYIRSTNFPYPVLDEWLAQAREKGWDTHVVQSGHDVMLDAPAELAEILHRLAQ